MKLHRNVYIWYTTTFFSFAAFILPIWVIFNTEVLHLSNTEAFLLGVVPYGLSALFEIPTGSWADKYGRARTYQIGGVLYILSAASFLFLTNFYALLILQLVGAVGLAMRSGGLEALVHDSITGPDKDAAYARVHSHKMAILFTSRVATAALGGVLYTVNPKAPILAGVIMYIVGLIASLFFKEVRTETPTDLSSFDHIKETLALFLGKKTLLALMLLVVLYTFCSEALFALYQPYFKSIGIHFAEYGVFYAVISALSAVGALTVARFMKRFSTSQILLAMMVAVLFTFSLMLLKQPLLTYIAIIPSSLAFGFIMTLTNTSVQKLISSRHQATALSIASLVTTFTYFVAVVGLGMTLDLVSAFTANAVLAAVTLVSLVPFLSALRRPKLAEQPA